MSRLERRWGLEEPIAVPLEILVEMAGLIERRFGWSAANSAVEGLFALPHVTCAPQVHLTPLRALFAKERGRLSLADCVVVADVSRPRRKPPHL